MKHDSPLGRPIFGLIFFAAGLVGASLFGQVREVMEVRLRQIPLHVFDAAGEPVAGLTQDDFECVVGKTPIAPMGFRPKIVAGVAQPITVFLDTSFMERQSFGEFKNQLGAALWALAETGQPIKLVHFDEKLQTLVPGSEDGEELIDGLSMLEFKGSLRARLSMMQTDLNEAYAAFRGSLDSGESRDMIKFNAENVFQKIAEKERVKLGHFHQVSNQIVTLCDQLSLLDGHQCLYLITGGFFLEKNGQHENTFKTIRKHADEINRAGVTVNALVHNPSPAIGLERLKVKNRGFFNNYQAMRELSEYSYQEVRSQIELLDSGGNTLAEGEQQYITGPVELCRWTGGRCEASSPNFLKDKLPAFLATHQAGYELDFVLESQAQDEEISIRLRENKGFKVLYPQTFRPPKPFRQWTKEEVETSFHRIVFFGQPYRSSLTCSWGYRIFNLPDGRFALPVFGGLDASSTSRKKGIEVGFTALTEDRDVLDLIHETVSGKKVSGKPLIYHVLLCDSLPKTLRFFVRELDEGAYSIQEVELEELEVPDQGLSIVGLNLGTSEDYELLPLPHLRSKDRDARRKDRAKNDPFLVGKRVIIPSLQPIFQKGDHAPVYFQLSGVTGDLASYGFDFYMTLESESHVVPGKLSKITPVSEGMYRVEGFVTLEGLEIGNYVFTVVIFAPGKTPVQKSCYAWIVGE